MPTNPTPNKLPEFIDSRWFAAASLLCVTAACTIWFVSNGEAGWWPLTIALIPWAARVLTGQLPISKTPFDWFLLLFLATAVAGIFTAYDGQAAWSKFWLIAGAILLFYALAGQPPENIWPVIYALGIIGTSVALFYLLANDWSASPGKFAALQTLQYGWMDIRPQGLAKLTWLLPNDADGLMAMLAPALVSSIFYWFRSQRWSWFAAAGIAGAILASGLILSASRGAWLALAGGFLVWLGWIVSGNVSKNHQISRRQVFLSFLSVLILLAILFILLFPGGMVGMAQQMPGPDRTNRLDISRDTLNLINDYWITGAGLDSFPGIYSQYSQITPLFLFDHAHNLYLDITLELGIAGLVSFLAVAGLTFWLLAGMEYAKPAVEEKELLYGSLMAGMTVTLLHGFVDDPLFGSRGLLLLFVFSGITAAVTQYQSTFVNVSGVRLPRSVILLSAVLILGALTAILSRRPLLSAWHANRGAVMMAQAELDSSWPTNQWQGSSNVPNLAGAESRFHKALELNNSNVTALYRSGLIALARQDFDTAVGLLTAAHNLNPDHRGVRKALGYSALWYGDLETAEALLLTLPESEYELGNYIDWWRQQGRPELGQLAQQLLERHLISKNE